MRAEEKELEGPELERAQRLEHEDTKADELPVLASEEVVDVGLAHRGRLFDAITLILAGEQLEISLLYLPQRETHALEFLQTAVTGHDGMGEFVYAENRSAMLEQALAVLQQNLTHGSAAELAGLHAKFESMTSRLAELREELGSLEEAQDDLERAPVFEKQAETDDEDDAEPEPEPEPEDSITGFIASALQALAQVTPTPEASSLVGPELPDEPERPSTLTDEDVPKPKGKKRG